MGERRVYEMKAKFNDGFKTIIMLEENGCLPTLWESVRTTTLKYVEVEVDKIGDVMKDG